MEVEVVGGDIENAIRFFKKIVGKDGIHSQIKRRLSHVKASERRRAKLMLAARRRRELERKKELREHGRHKGLRGSLLSG